MDVEHHIIGIAAHVLLEVRPSMLFRGSDQPHNLILFADNMLSKKMAVFIVYKENRFTECLPKPSAAAFRFCRLR